MNAKPSQTHLVAAATTMLCAMAVIGVIDNAIGVLASEVGLWQFLIWRMVLALPFIWIASRIGLGGLRPKRLWAVALRGGLVATAMLFYFGALAIMPIAQALAGLFTSPIFILLITSVALQKPVGFGRVFAVTLGFAGTAIVLNPDLASLTWVTFLPVFGGFFYALGAIATRTICREETVLSMLVSVFIIQGILGIVALLSLSVIQPEPVSDGLAFFLRGWVWSLSPMAHLLFAVQAVGSVVGIGLIIRAYQIGEPSYVAVFEYSVFIFGPMAAYFLLDQALGLNTALGIVFIAVAGIVIVLRSRQE